MARVAFGMMRHARAPDANSPTIVMYLTPWYRQATGWFAVALGIALATRAGARVSFLINDMPYPAIHPQELAEVLAFAAFCNEFEGMYPFHRLSTFHDAAAPGRSDAIGRTVEEALALDVRHRSGSGTLHPTHATSFRQTARTPLRHIATAIDRFYAEVRPDALFCAGGVANGSYVVTRLAADHGVRVPGADSGLGVLWISAHSIASQFSELVEAYRHILTQPVNLVETARAAGFAFLRKKIAAARGYTAPLPPCDLILPLGYDWDTVALGVESLYEDQNTWLRDTIAYVTRHHPTAHMVVRSHPHELRIPCPDNDVLLNECRAQASPTLHVMCAQDRIPVYGLLETAKAVVACQSTVVMEAQMQGVPAIALRDNYYVLSGVMARPHTREAYYHWLDRHLTGARLPVAESASAAAALLYFLLESMSKDATQFTPHAADMWAWLHGDPIADLISPAMGDVLRTIAGDIPLATLKVRRALGLDALPPGAQDPLAA